MTRVESAGNAGAGLAVDDEGEVELSARAVGVAVLALPVELLVSAGIVGWLADACGVADVVGPTVGLNTGAGIVGVVAEVTTSDTILDLAFVL